MRNHQKTARLWLLCLKLAKDSLKPIFSLFNTDLWWIFLHIFRHLNILFSKSRFIWILIVHPIAKACCMQIKWLDIWSIHLRRLSNEKFVLHTLSISDRLVFLLNATILIAKYPLLVVNSVFCFFFQRCTGTPLFCYSYTKRVNSLRFTLTWDEIHLSIKQILVS